MRTKLIAMLAIASTLNGCGDEAGQSAASMVSLQAQTSDAAKTTLAVAPSPVPSPAPSPTPSAAPVNDSLVLNAAVPSLDSSVYARRTYQAVPSVARVGKRTWAVWFGDTSSVAWESVGNFLILAYSDDNGANWSREYYLVPPNRAADRAFDPRLWLAPDGKLWVLYTQSGGGIVFDGQLGAWVNVISNPLAAEPTFEPGFRLADGQPHRPFQYQNQWYIPIDYLGGNPPRFRERQGKHVYALNWQARTATKVSTVPRTPNADYNEPTFVALKDDSLLTQSRSYDGIYQSVTAPGSLVFPAPSRWLFYPSTFSRHSISRSPSGRLVMVWNQLNNGTRTNMAVAFSEDEGKSWPYSYVFDDRSDISYPDVDYFNNGDILVVYDRSRNGLKQILMARIDEASIIAGTPQVVKRIINIPEGTKKPKPGT